jgi:hypothetical protein
MGLFGVPSTAQRSPTYAPSRAAQVLRKLENKPRGPDFPSHRICLSQPQCGAHAPGIAIYIPPLAEGFNLPGPLMHAQFEAEAPPNPPHCPSLSRRQSPVNFGRYTISLFPSTHVPYSPSCAHTGAGPNSGAWQRFFGPMWSPTLRPITVGPSCHPEDSPK